ncbi:MAG: ferric reductase-like transmembrane domain-containing protein, partial [bacterium]|nr:ferric reductase-like transmembrane domain-containing protein [bacterium]
MSFIKNNLGWGVIFVLSFFPVLLWAVGRPFEERFSGPARTLTSFGQIAGLVGMAMFALALILSGKFGFLENRFGGPGKTYSAHHFLGAFSFVLLLSHPLFLAGKYLLISSKSAALFLLPGNDWPINFGIFGLLSLIILLVPTFFMRLPYEKWKLTHKFLGLTFFLAGFHSFFIPSDIALFLPLKIYMFSLFAAGFLAYISTILSLATVTGGASG